MKAHLRSRAEHSVILVAVDDRVPGQRGRMRWRCPLRNAGSALRWIAKEVFDHIPTAPLPSVAGVRPKQINVVTVARSRWQASADMNLRPSSLMRTLHKLQFGLGLA